MCGPGGQVNTQALIDASESLRVYAQHRQASVIRAAAVLPGDSSKVLRVAVKAAGHPVLQLRKADNKYSHRTNPVCVLREAAVLAGMATDEGLGVWVQQPWGAGDLALEGLTSLHNVVAWSPNANGRSQVFACLSKWGDGCSPAAVDKREVITHPQGDKQRRQFVASALKGVAALHKRGLAHRDIKLENMLVVNPGRKGSPVSALLIDFGGAYTERVKSGPIKKKMESVWDQLLGLVTDEDLEQFVSPSRNAGSGAPLPRPAAKGSRFSGRSAVMLFAAASLPAAPGAQRKRARSNDAAGGSSGGGGDPMRASSRLQAAPTSVHATHLHSPGSVLQGQWGTPYWRGVYSGTRAEFVCPFEQDCTAMAVVVVSFAMGEQVTKRAEVVHANARKEDEGKRKSEEGVLAWLQPEGRCKGGPPTLGETVADGLAWAWDRRLPGEDWEPRLQGPVVGPEMPAALVDWKRSSATARTIRELVNGGSRPDGSVGDSDTCCEAALALFEPH